jgi:hypothetical protein
VMCVKSTGPAGIQVVAEADDEFDRHAGSLRPESGIAAGIGPYRQAVWQA